MGVIRICPWPEKNTSLVGDLDDLEDFNGGR